MNTIDANGLLLQMRALAARAQAGATLHETASARPADFQGLLTRALAGVNETQQDARVLAERFDRGDPKVDLSEVMIASQKANVSFQAVTQVRNKLVSAYQDIMNMPI
ncbi:MAG: flagellar hook-basal body complex protein FliE [Gammaproteobacteria bacterium]